jgi:putative spermidine/putrescine transport system ATP-binding protein
MPATDHAYVRFERVQKSYDGISLVVKSLDLDIRRGEFLTLLGPSGSGKTTCLMMLAGFERPTAGMISIGGRRIDATPPHKREIGVVFQNYALFPHMTVAENVAFPLQVRRVCRAESEMRVKRALAMVQLEGLLARRPAQLSGGQQQRVALARALVFEPRIVLMDEPLGALDKQLRETMQYEIKHLHDRLGVTIVYVTHDQGEALTMSDRIAVFHQGRVQQLADPAELYERPGNAFVAGFIGENNRLQGRLRELAGSTCVVEVAGVAVRAAVADITAADAVVWLSFRPERVILDPPPESCATIVGGRILELIYHGDHIRLRLEALGSQEFIVKLPNRGPMDGLQLGRSVRVGWAVEDCRAMAPSC